MIIWKAARCRLPRLRAVPEDLRVPGSAPSPNTAAEIPTSDAPMMKGVTALPPGMTEEVVASWVGFADQPAWPEGTRKPTTEWPIQKYLWSDYMVGPGDQVAYRVAPMVGKAGASCAARCPGLRLEPCRDNRRGDGRRGHGAFQP